MSYNKTSGKDSPPSQWKAFFQEKCPRCRRGKIFQHSAMSTSFSKMNANCPHCDYKYEIEPGFFWGAMYVNYALSIAVAVAALVITAIIFSETTPWHYLTAITVAIFFSATKVFRLSRTITIYFFSFVKFEPELYRKESSELREN